MASSRSQAGDVQLDIARRRQQYHPTRTVDFLEVFANPAVRDMTIHPQRPWPACLQAGAVCTADDHRISCAFPRSWSG